MRVFAGGLTNKTHPTIIRDDPQALPHRAANDPGKTMSHQSLLTDVVMAGPSGPQLAERVRLDYHAVAVVFMSGYTSDAVQGNESGDRLCGETALPPRSPLTHARVAIV